MVYIGRRKEVASAAKTLYSNFLFKDGGSYIAYASKLQGKIGLKSTVAGEYKFRWFDCANGSEVTMGNVPVAGGNQSCDKPGRIGSELAGSIHRTCRGIMKGIR